MSTPVNQQKQLIKKYFNLLVKEFITDPRHNENISIVFKNDLGSEGNVQTLGKTERSGGSEHWKESNGVEVPGSRWQEPFTYTISFLNHYKDNDKLRGTVVHEFAHLYLYSTVGDHDHDDRFYSTMEYLESWLDKNQKLSPRTDKGGDRFQYVGDNKSKVNNKENTCSECSYSSPHHSPQCSYNQNKPRPIRQPKPGQKTDITSDPQKAVEFDQLMKQLEASQDLTNLEVNYQNIKNNSLYKNNKKSLDNFYKLKKSSLQSPNNNQHSSINDPTSNKNRLGSREYFLITLVAVGIVLVVMIGYLALFDGREKRTLATKNKKK